MKDTMRIRVQLQFLIWWFMRRWAQVRDLLFGRSKKGVLVYVGMHKGREFDMIFRQYHECYGFEANPELFAFLQEKYQNEPTVKLFNCAASSTKGEVSFNISSNNGASS